MQVQLKQLQLARFLSCLCFELWRDLLTLTAFVGDPEPIKKQATQNKLLFYFTVLSVP